MLRPLAALVLLCLLSCDDGAGQEGSPLMEYEASDSATTIPNSCEDAGAEAASGCILPGTVIPRNIDAPDRPPTRSESYQYEAVCEPGATPQWSFITYTAQTPGDGAVHFRARVADAEAELSAADWTNVALAQSSPTDTQSCNPGDPGCPVSLYDALGGRPDVSARWIEFELRYYDSTSGDPVFIDGWAVELTCETI